MPLRTWKYAFELQDELKKLSWKKLGKNFFNNSSSLRSTLMVGTWWKLWNLELRWKKNFNIEVSFCNYQVLDTRIIRILIRAEKTGIMESCSPLRKCQASDWNYNERGQCSSCREEWSWNSKLRKNISISIGFFGLPRFWCKDRKMWIFMQSSLPCVERLT